MESYPENRFWAVRSQARAVDVGVPPDTTVDYENLHKWRSIIGKEQIGWIKPMATAISRLLRTGNILGKVVMHKWRESLPVYQAWV